jgi:hypothetical protein
MSDLRQKLVSKQVDTIEANHKRHGYTAPIQATKTKTVSEIILSNPTYYLNTGEGWGGNMDLAELQTWYFVENPHAELQTFYDVLKKLEKGDVVHLNDGITVQKHKQFDEMLLPELPTEGGDACTHPNKYINSAGGVAFWVCPSCGKDLGNA